MLTIEEITEPEKCKTEDMENLPYTSKIKNIESITLDIPSQTVLQDDSSETVGKNSNKKSAEALTEDHELTKINLLLHFKEGDVHKLYSPVLKERLQGLNNITLHIEELLVSGMFIKSEASDIIKASLELVLFKLQDKNSKVVMRSEQLLTFLVDKIESDKNLMSVGKIEISKSPLIAHILKFLLKKASQEHKADIKNVSHNCLINVLNSPLFDTKLLLKFILSKESFIKKKFRLCSPHIKARLRVLNELLSISNMSDHIKSSKLQLPLALLFKYIKNYGLSREDKENQALSLQIAALLVQFFGFSNMEKYLKTLGEGMLAPIQKQLPNMKDSFECLKQNLLN